VKLSTVSAGKGIVNKVKLLGMGIATGERAPDVVRVILYRSEFFGRPFNRCVHRLLRGASEFTLGERELFAAFVSRTNNCQFCHDVHSAVAARALGDEVVSKVFQDFNTAPVSPQVRASLAFLEKLTRAPSEIGPDDVRQLHDAGVMDSSAEGLINICYIFTVINRIADSLGFEVPSASALSRTAGILLKHGYTLGT
jgi:uncharacterized peroxidase-related enzyme